MMLGNMLTGWHRAFLWTVLKTISTTASTYSAPKIFLHTMTNSSQNMHKFGKIKPANKQTSIEFLRIGAGLFSVISGHF